MESSWAKALLETGRSSRGVVDIDGFVELFVAWLACLPVRVVYVSLWWGGRCGVVGLRNGDCAGRHGAARARPYVGASHTPEDNLA